MYQFQRIFQLKEGLAKIHNGLQRSLSIVQNLSLGCNGLIQECLATWIRNLLFSSLKFFPRVYKEDDSNRKTAYQCDLIFQRILQT